MICIFSSKYIVAALAVMTMTYNSNGGVYAQNSVITETAVNNAQETVSKYICPFFPLHRTHFLVVFRSQSHSSQSLQYPEARRISRSRKITFNTSFAVYRIHFRHARKSIYNPYIYQDRESKYSLQIHKPIFSSRTIQFWSYFDPRATTEIYQSGSSSVLVEAFSPFPSLRVHSFYNFEQRTRPKSVFK
jgi:hypothetical protein